MTPANGEDMTACFGALHVKMIPKRAFSCYPNRPHLAASVYCHHRGGTAGRGVVQDRNLARTPPTDSLRLLNQEGKISNHDGENDPRGHELQCLLFPLS